ncbi:MAG: single-stranded-DNA-specific exonuclease RecJ [Candidatus Paceibacterota bacterium]
MDKHTRAEPVPEDAAGELKQYGDFAKILLYNRGIKTSEAAEKFLNPDYERDVYDPFLILNMDKAVERIIRATETEEKIVIYGDYDCDGIPGSVVLHDFFKKIGYKNFSNYIPHRHKEGYGLNNGAIEKFAKDGVSLIITVDLAIANVEEVAYAENLGINVIVTDHHLPQEKIPQAYAVINSKQAGDTYPDNMLCGAGVAFKLVQALLKKKGKEWEVPEGWEKWLLDMAGLSTIADMVPLVNENRAIAYYGLKVMRKSPRAGFVKLLRKMRVEQSSLTEDDVAFMIAPRINAASRMDIPIEAFRLLSTTDETLADELSDHLHNLNDTRKGLVSSMIKEARKHVEERGIKDVIVIGNPNWKPGVIGLIAGKLVEEYGRPAFVWGREDSEHIKGSCRSDGTVNLVELMVAVEEGFFLNIGGHEFSGGFSVSHEKIHFLEEELLKAHKKVKKVTALPSGEMIDCALTIDDVTEANYKTIERLAPYGVGNPKPAFLFSGAEIKEVSKFGKEKNHLKLIFENSKGVKISAIGFFMDAGDYKMGVEAGAKINLIATIELSLFMRRPEIRLRIIDIV